MTRILAAVALISMTLMLLYSTIGLPALFDPDAPASAHVSDRYIEKSYEETGTKNYVTAILTNYRSFDTLGEAVVIFTAGLASALVLRPYGRKEKKHER